jgi:predicted membrane protein (TIGR00267 family)
MKLLQELRQLLHLTHAWGIARRYFVVNGFDGALTMLGVVLGFYFSGQDGSAPLALSACLGAAIALGVSGVSSAYVSETAERTNELQALESAMITDLSGSRLEQGARLAPLVIALVNGLAPLCIALLIMTPLWWLESLEGAILMAFGVIFLLGVFLGGIRGESLLKAGLRTLLIGLSTCAVIFLVSGSG